MIIYLEIIHALVIIYAFTVVAVVDSAAESFNRVDVGSIADVSEVRVASIFKVGKVGMHILFRYPLYE
jgi:hypothetical protein